MAGLATFPYQPSNATEGEIFKDLFCRTCAKFRDDKCRILSKTQWFKVHDKDYPSEWVKNEDNGNPRCLAFQEKDDGIRKLSLTPDQLAWYKRTTGREPVNAKQRKHNRPVTEESYAGTLC